MSTEIITRGSERDLTPQQQRFVSEFVGGDTFAGRAEKAAKAAGYGERSARVYACELLKMPHIQCAIDEALREAIGGSLTVQAVTVIRQIIGDENAPLKLRGDMAARVLEFSGLVERTKLAKGRQTGLDGRAAGDKRLAEMTREELEALVRGGAAVLQAAAALPAGPVIEGNAQNSAQLAPIAAE